MADDGFTLQCQGHPATLLMMPPSLQEINLIQTLAGEGT